MRSEERGGESEAGGEAGRELRAMCLATDLVKMLQRAVFNFEMRFGTRTRATCTRQHHQAAGQAADSVIMMSGLPQSMWNRPVCALACILNLVWL